MKTISLVISPSQPITKQLEDLVTYLETLNVKVSVGYFPDFAADWNILIPLFELDVRMVSFIQGLIKQKYGGRLTFVSPTIPFVLAKENNVDYVASIPGLFSKYFSS
jgi:hypothetical protein